MLCHCKLALKLRWRYKYNVYGMSVDSADYETSRSRVKVLTALLKSGIPLSKLDNFRELLEENSCSLSSSTNLRQLVPFVHAGEMSKLKSEISGKHISVCYDGTTHVAEAFVTVIRYVDDDWAVKQRVARLMLLAKSFNIRRGSCPSFDRNDIYRTWHTITSCRSSNA